MDALSKSLRRRARELGLSDAEVARRAGLTERRYGHYVAGSREPDLATLLRICQVLAVTPNDLLQVDPRDEQRGELALYGERMRAAFTVFTDDERRLAVELIETLLKHRRKASE